MSEKIFFSEQIRPLRQNIIQKKQQEINKNRTNQFQQSFQEVLEKQITGEQKLKFSKHAQQRLSLRNINLDEKNMEKISTAVEKARSKGAKESLILMDDLALVVSIKNNTVITAVDGPNIKDNVFTNIDSTVII